MDREFRMIDYLPDFLQDYREYRVLMEAESKEFRIRQEQALQMLENMFIPSANEVGIRKFEELLEIYPEVQDTLAARRARVLARWIDAVPYTYKLLKSRLDALCGEAGYKMKLDYAGYRLELETHLNSPGAFEELAYLLYTLIPCNIQVESVNSLQETGEHRVYSGGAVRYANVVLLTNDTERCMDADHKVYSGGAVKYANVVMLTNDTERRMDADHRVYSSGAVKYANTVILTNDTEHEMTADHKAYQGGGLRWSKDVLISDSGERGMEAAGKAGTGAAVRQSTTYLMSAGLAGLTDGSREAEALLDDAERLDFVQAEIDKGYEEEKEME